MANDLGLKNSFVSRVYGPLQEYRGSDATPGKEIGLIEFMNESGITNGAEPMTWEKLFNELGLPSDANLSLGHLLSLSGDVTYLAPEIVREFIVRGMDLNARYTDLIMGTENVSSLDVSAPYIDYLNPKPVAIAEAETIPVAKYTWGKKSITLRKKAIGLDWSDELILSVKLPLLRQWLQRVGVELNAMLYSAAVTTLSSGDQVDGSDAVSVVGVASAGTLTFADLVRLWVRAQLIGAEWRSLITNETMANGLLALAEFKPTAGGLGGAAVNLDIRNKVVPNQLPHFMSSTLTDNQVLLFDPSQSLLYLVFRPLLVESDRIMQRQVNGVYCSIMSGFTTVERKARIAIDKSKAFSGYGFPSWMEPLV